MAKSKSVGKQNISRRSSLTHMQRIYDAYIRAHSNFETHESRKRILTINAFDFSGVEAFTYDALIEASTAILDEEQQHTLQYISATIGNIQGNLVDIKKTADKFAVTMPQTMQEVNDYLTAVSKVAQDLKNIFNQLPNGPRSYRGQVLKVDDIVNNILNQETYLRNQAAKFLRPGYRTNVKLVPQTKKYGAAKKLKKKLVGFRASGKGKKTQTAANLSELYSALMAGLGQALGTAYENVLSLYIGTMPPKLIGNALQGWATNLSETRKDPRQGGLITGAITHVSIPEATYLTQIQHAEGTQALIDWYVRENGVGLQWEFTVSQKEYREKDMTNELDLAALSTKISGKITQVTDDLTVALALCRAFASPSSRGTFHGRTKGLADTILRQTIFDDIFGSGTDSISDFLINRVFYSAESIVSHLFDDSTGFRSGQGKERFTVEVGAGGTESSRSKDPVKAAARDTARQTEMGAAGVWLSPARLLAIQRATFETHWVFEKAWFDNVITEF